MKSVSRLKLIVAVMAGTFVASPVVSAEEFRNTISGEDLKVLETAAPEGRDTEAVKRFLETGVNAYNEVKACLPKGEEVYLTSCSGCHGHVGEAMAWIRHLYTGDVAEAEWLTPEQKKVFKPYKPEAHASAEGGTKTDAGAEECKVSAN